ncbi:hypothetical protein ACF0H5_024576 [Mactra antiquata]
MLQSAPAGEFILDIRSPVEEKIEVRQGKKRKVTKQFLPGYMFIELELDDFKWREQCSLLRALQGVVGFVGYTPKDRPHPVPADEIRAVLQSSGELAAERRYSSGCDFSPGEVLKVSGGPFEGFSGTVDEVHAEKERLRVMVVIFGRPTPVELDYAQVEKIV